MKKTTLRGVRDTSDLSGHCAGVSFTLPIFILFLAFLFTGSGADAQSRYFWVGNSGNWNDLSKWSSTSGGAGFAYTKPPTEKDTVFFDRNSFTTTGRRVTINVAAVCAAMDWTGAVTGRSGTGTSGPGLILSNALVVTTRLELNSAMQGFSGSGSIGLGNSSGGNTDVNFNSVPTGASGGIIFISNGGAINLKGDINAPSTWVYFRGGQISTNNYRLFVRNIVSDGTVPRSIDFGSSFISTQRMEVTRTSATHIFNAGTSVIEFRNTSSNYNYILLGAGIALNEVFLTAGDLWRPQFETGSSIRSLQIDANTQFRGSLRIEESLSLAPGKNLSIPDNGIVMANGATLNLVGDCANRPYLSSTSTAVARLNLGAAAANISFAAFENINIVAPARVSAPSSVDLGGNVNIDFSSTVASRVFYWRTGSGFWNDINRWSFSGSGGPVAGCLPGPDDDVIFDRSAFTGGADTVKIDGQVFARNVDFSNANGQPVVYGGRPFLFDAGLSYYAPYSPSTLFSINGSLTLSRNVKWDLNQNVKFVGSGNHTVTSAGNGFGHNVYFAGKGNYTLTDSLWVRGSSPNQTIVTSGALVVSSGGFFTAGNKVIARSFVSNTSATRVIDFGNSELLLNEKEGTTYDLSPTFEISRVNLTINLSSATIRVRSEGVNRVQINLNVATRVGALIIEDPVPYPTAFSRISFFDGVIVDRLRIMSSMWIQGSITINDSLSLREGNYRFQVGKTISFAPNAVLHNNPASVACESYISLDADAPGTYTFRKTTGTLELRNAAISNNVATGGAVFTSLNGTLNNSTGWLNTQVIGRVLYWVGNGGNWSDRRHWSLASGGAGGECAPSTMDSVIFDQNSFTLANQVVTLSDGSIFVKGINGSGVGRAVTVSGTASARLFNGGSLILSSSMNWQVLGAISFTGAANHVIDVRSPLSSRNIYISGVGTYRVISDLVATFCAIDVNQGSFVVDAGKTLSVASFGSNSTAARRLVLNGASLITQGDLRSIFSVSGSGGIYDFTNSSYTVRNTGGWTPLISAPGFRFSRVALEGQVLEVGPGITFDVLDFRRSAGVGRVTFTGNTNIMDSIIFRPGGVYSFAAGTTLSIADTADILANGTSTNYTTFNSSASGNQFIINKPKHPSDPTKAQLCFDYISIGNSRVVTGTNNAVFKTNTEWRDLGNNTGWQVLAATQPGAGSIVSVDGMCKGSNQALLKVSISQGSFPLDVIIRNTTTGRNDTLKGLTGTGFPFVVDVALPRPAVSSVYRLEQIGVYRCDLVTPSASGPFNQVTYTVYSGGAGVWTNASNTTNWDDCANWGDGGVATNTSDVTTSVATGLSRVITLPAGVRRVRNFTLGANVTLQFSPGAVLEVEGNLTTNSGSAINMSSADASLVIKGSWARTNTTVTMTGARTVINFKGASVQTIPSGTYNKILVDNPGGVNLATGSNVISNDLDIAVGSNLTLNGGAILTLRGVLNRQGSFTMNASSRLVMGGTTSQSLPGGSYAILAIDNPAGVTLAANSTINGSLVLTRGIVSTGVNTLTVANNAATAISGQSNTSYVIGRLARRVATNTSTYVFPVGIASGYHPLEMVNGNLAGVTTLTASLAAKLGTDDGMSVSEGGLVYQKVAPALVWTVTPDVQPTSGSYGMRCYFANSTSTISLLKDNEFALVKRADASTNGADWSTGSGTLNPVNGAGRKVSDGFAFRTGLRSFSQFGIGYAGVLVLPVKLSDFSAVRMNDHVQVKWVTEEEIRNRYFEVERSLNGIDFTVVARLNGAINSSTARTYTYRDQNAPPSKLYYRLRSVDDMGIGEYSRTVTVSGSANAAIIVKVNPNPASSYLDLTLNAEAAGGKAIVSDMFGRELMRAGLKGKQTRMDVSRFASGIYILRLVADNGETIYHEKFIIRK